MEFASDMEFWLLVIGGAVIIGVIGFAIASSNANKRHRRVRERNTIITTPGDLFDALGGDENGKPAKSGKGNRGRGRKEPVVGGSFGDAASAEADANKVEGAGNTEVSGTGQGSLIDDPEEDRAVGPEPAQAGKTQPAPNETDHKPQLLVVYVMARGQGEFRCSGVNRVLTRSGCMLDERGVFHLKDEDHRVVFSVVNALEPATFDPDRIHVDNTRGLVFFFGDSRSGRQEATRYHVEHRAQTGAGARRRAAR